MEGLGPGCPGGHGQHPVIIKVPVSRRQLIQGIGPPLVEGGKGHEQPHGRIMVPGFQGVGKKGGGPFPHQAGGIKEKMEHGRSSPTPATIQAHPGAPRSQFPDGVESVARVGLRVACHQRQAIQHRGEAIGDFTGEGVEQGKGRIPPAGQQMAVPAIHEAGQPEYAPGRSPTCQGPAAQRCAGDDGQKGRRIGQKHSFPIAGLAIVRPHPGQSGSLAAGPGQAGHETVAVHLEPPGGRQIPESVFPAGTVQLPEQGIVMGRGFIHQRLVPSRK